MIQGFILSVLLLPFSLGIINTVQAQSKTSKDSVTQQNSKTADDFFADFEAAQKNREQSEKKRIESLDWKKINSEFQENRKRANPMVYSDLAYNKLNLSSLMCPAEFKDQVDKCQYYTCVYPIELPGAPKLSADFIIHGLNSAGSCAITLPNAKRYFVPKIDLPYFYDAFRASLRTDKMEQRSNTSTGSEVSKIKRKIFYKDAACLVDLEIKELLDESNLLLATPENVKKFPSRTIILVGGKQYIGKESDIPEMRYVEKYVSHTLDKSSPPVCTERKVDLLYQLAKKNLAFDINPIKIGF